MLSEKCFVVFYVFSFPAGVCVGTLILIASIPLYLSSVFPSSCFFRGTFFLTASFPAHCIPLPVSTEDTMTETQCQAEIEMA